MTATPDPTGTIDVALRHTERLLAKSPRLAMEQATEILKVAPKNADALLLLGRAQSAAGLGEAAVRSFQQAVKLQPNLGDAWLLLADHLSAMDEGAAAEQARAQSLRCATRDPRLLAPAAALCDNRLGEAETLLRAHLLQFPTDIAAIRMFAEVAARLGRLGDAENLLARCLELAPGFEAARHNYAVVLFREDKLDQALPQVKQLLRASPNNASYRTLYAALMAKLGEYPQAIELYQGVLKEYPNQPKVWMSLGHALKTSGQQPLSIEAYRRSIALKASYGEPWWSLANLKTLRFTPEDLDAMRAGLARDDLEEDDRLHFHFALGKALEDAGHYAESFEHYAQGNALRRATNGYDPEENTDAMRRSVALYSEAFFAARAGSGSTARDPIFIVGLPRSGSTLIEQILSSHSQVEGTMELPDIIAIARRLGGKKLRGEKTLYPEVVAQLGPDALRELGEEYLQRTRVQRKTAAPFFIDKMPNNFAHTGLIHLILPNARIIDARRHPMGCCFSAFKQHFARGQRFTYSLGDVGRYYHDYVELMAHFDRVLPGRVHRVFYEAMVQDTESEVRRLLDYCGLTFENGCLKFWQNERAVRTASSEQVRQPIFRDGMDQWRHFESWLAPLEHSLGSVLETYPAVGPLLG
jgi:tetratricopeptide (TPR) repeat protein